MRHFRLVVCAGIMLLISGVASAQQDFINNFAGGGPNNVPATSANVNYPTGTATDGLGNFYIVSPNQSRVFKVNSSGTLTVLAGNGFPGYSGDGGPATQAELALETPSQIAVDSTGNVYIADTGNCIVRVVNASTGIISRFAGTPQYCSFGGDGQSATAAGTSLSSPFGVAVDSSGNVYISDVYNYRIRQVNTSGTINTVAGNGTYCSSYPCGDGGLATSASLGYAFSLAVDGAGNVFIPDFYNYVVRELNVSTGNISLVAGTPGTYCFQSGSSFCGDGGPATSAGFYYIYGIASDARGNLFISDLYNYDIREVYCADSAVACTAPGGFTKHDIYTVAGTGGTYGNSGDGGSATGATLGYAYGVAVDSSDDIFIPNYQYDVVRKVNASTATINTVAGNGTISYTGNNIPATGAVLNNPWGVAFDSTGNAYIADRGNCIVRKVDTSGVITLFAGTAASCGFGGDGGSATAVGAYLSSPSAVATDSAGNVYIADQYNLRIRKVDTSGNISTFAGDGSYGFDGDGPATSHSLYYPQAVATDAAGNVYIADFSNYRIRKVDISGNMTTIAGNGNYCYTYSACGDGGPATSATMSNPSGVAVDKAGNVYFTDTSNSRVRQINTAGIIDTYAGNGANTGFGGDGGFATQTSLSYPEQVAVDPAGDVIIADTSNQRIRLVDGQGRIHTVAGNGGYGYSGPEENVLATTAELANPYGVGVDSSGNIYIGDTNNNLVRQVSALAELNSSPSSVVFNAQQVGTTSPAATVTLVSAGPLTIGSITPSANFTEQDDCPGSLPSGANCTIDVYFTPTSAGTVNGTLTIADNAFFNSPLVINLQGSATDLTIAPNPLNFGTQPVGTPVAQNVTITGLTTYAATSATLSGDTTDFSITSNSNTCTGTKSSCVIGITFNPSSTSPVKATLAIHDSDPTSAQLVTITGTGCTSCTGPLETFTPSSVNFAPQSIKTSSAGTKVTFTNNGTGTLNITKMVPSTGFKVSVTGITGPACSITASTTVLPGGSCSFYVIFSPTTSGNPINGTVKTTWSPADAKGNTSLTLQVSGEGEPVSFTPNPVIFKPVFPNTSATNTKVTFKNVGTATLTLTSLVPSPSSNYAINYTGLTTGNCSAQPLALAASASCTFNVAFTPGSTLGVIPGTVTANFTGDSKVSQMVVNVSGTVTEVSLSPATLAFGTVASGTLNKSVTVTNKGTTPLSFSGTPTITGTGSGQFAVVPYSATGPTSTCLNGAVTLSQNKSCTFTVQFTHANDTTTFTTYLNISDNGGGSPQQVKMTATD
jgi:hypothetical protein